MTNSRHRVQDILKKVREATEHRIDVDQLLIDILVKFGGTEGLAEALRQTYDAAMDGSSIRARILADLMALVRQRTMSGWEGEVDEEDTEAMLMELLGGRNNSSAQQSDAEDEPPDV